MEWNPIAFIDICSMDVQQFQMYVFWTELYYFMWNANKATSLRVDGVLPSQDITSL